MHRLLITLSSVLLIAALSACTGSTTPATDSQPAAAAPAAAPAPAVAPVKHATAKETMQYVCKGAAETKYPRPGKCDDGSLRMADVADVADGVEIEYYCPMCAGQETAEPSRCTECGMFLSARVKGTAAKTEEAGDHEHGHDHGDGHDHGPH